MRTNSTSILAAALAALAVVGVPRAGAQRTLVEPTWPQKYSLVAGEYESYGFAVESPGPIVATARGGGQLRVTLRRADGSIAAEQRGVGTIVVNYTATAADVQKSAGWSVSVGSLMPAEPPDKIVETPSATTPVASGELSVTHPPGDVRKIISSKAPAPLPSLATAAVDVIASKRASEFQQSVAARQTQLVAQTKARLTIRPQVVQQAGRGAATTTGTSTQQVSSTSSAATGVGSNTPATVAAGPTIASLSVAEGQPGDAVMLTGSGFGQTPGEVHFKVSPTKDLTVKIATDSWNDTQIIAIVPPVDSLPPYNGQVYVMRGGVKSTFTPFHFVPTTAFATLGMTSDAILREPAWLRKECVTHPFAASPFWGYKDDDEFYLQTRLKNGWVVDAAYVAKEDGSLGVGLSELHFGGGYSNTTSSIGNATVTALQKDSDSPRIKVHWWANPSAMLTYCPKVVIRGPKGLPYF